MKNSTKEQKMQIRGKLISYEAVTQPQRNNFRLRFRDDECITVYLWGNSQRKFEKKAMVKGVMDGEPFVLLSN